MKRLFKGALLICLSALMAACDKATIQQEHDGDKIQISLSFSIGNSPLSIGGPMTGTKGFGEDLFDAIYQGIVSGEIIASYELTFKNINTGASTSISGKWTDNKTISLEKGTYTIYGISTAIGKGIYKDCSLSYQDEVTITPETGSITIKAQYDCSLLIVNDDSVDKILYYASQTDSAYFSQYHNLTYAFVKSAEDFTQGNNAYLKVYFKNGRSSIVDLGQINIQKGKYYLLENLNNYADAGLVLDIDKMENGDDSNKTISLDGRWDGVPEGTQVGIGEQRITLIISGNKVDVYIVAWGDHLKGTYTYENDKLNFSFKNEDAFDALIVEDTYKGWSMSDGALDPETFELKYTDELPYRWYQMDPEWFEMDVDFLSDFTFKMVDDKKAIGGPMNLEFIKRCDLNDKNEGDDNTVAIVFSVMGGSSTGASSSINSYIANNGGFKVWGFKKVNTSADWTTVFDGTTISSSDYGSTWTYSPLRYWDNLATGYNFYAIAPYEETPSPTFIVAGGDNNIKIGDADHTYKISTEKNLAINPTITNERQYLGFNKDYMLADKSITKNQLVTFNFHHILTKLNVKITITDVYIGSHPFTIKKLHIVGLEDDGYFVYNTTGMNINGWTTKSGSTYNWELNADYVLKNVPGNVADQTEYSGYYWLQTLIFPQTLTCAATGAQITAPAGKYLYIEYSIGVEIFKAYYDLAYVFNNQITTSGTYELKQGSEYTINIKVGPDPTAFETTVSDWADDVIDQIN